MNAYAEQILRTVAREHPDRFTGLEDLDTD